MSQTTELYPKGEPQISPLANLWPIGWLAPDGSFYPVRICGHGEAAAYLAQTLYPNVRSKHIFEDDQLIYEQNWVKVHGGATWLHFERTKNRDVPFTEPQRVVCQTIAALYRSVGKADIARELEKEIIAFLNPAALV